HSGHHLGYPAVLGRGAITPAADQRRQLELLNQHDLARILIEEKHTDGVPALEIEARIILAHPALVLLVPDIVPVDLEEIVEETFMVANVDPLRLWHSAGFPPASA